MKKHIIAMYDSGIGGLSIYNNLYSYIPNLRLIYIADRKNFPVGEKNVTEIKKYIFKIIDKLQELFIIDCLIIACNTASVAALNSLRNKYAFPIIGTVPAVKVAAENTVTKKIGVIATTITGKNNYLNNLINDFAANCEVTIKCSQKLVRLAEEPWYYHQEREKILQQELIDFKKTDIDYLVIGCTHFSFLINDLQKILGPDIKIIDSVQGVSKQTIRILDKQNNKLCLKKEPREKNRFYYTGTLKCNHSAILKRIITQISNLTFSGCLLT